MGHYGSKNYYRLLTINSTQHWQMGLGEGVVAVAEGVGWRRGGGEKLGGFMFHVGAFRK